MKRQTLHLALLACIGLAACHTTRDAAPTAAASATQASKAAEATNEARDQSSRQRNEPQMLAVAPPAPTAAPVGMLLRSDSGGMTLDTIR